MTSAGIFEIDEKMQLHVCVEDCPVYQQREVEIFGSFFEQDFSASFPVEGACFGIKNKSLRAVLLNHKTLKAVYSGNTIVNTSLMAEDNGFEIYNNDYLDFENLPASDQVIVKIEDVPTLRSISNLRENKETVERIVKVGGDK